MKKCIYCEEFKKNGVLVNDDEEQFVCDDCLGVSEIWYCDDCEQYHFDEEQWFDIYDINGIVIKKVCDHSISNNNYEYCDKCGKYYDYNLTRVNDGDWYYCNDCLDSCDHCDICDEYYDNYCEFISYNDGDGYCCDNCAPDALYYCSECGGYFTEDYFNDDEHTEVCDRCYQEKMNDYKNKVLSYHAFNNWQKHFATNEEQNENNSFMGFELEIDTGECYDTNKINGFAKYINENLNTICEHDGSLSSRGIEIISHPSTLKYYYEHFDDFDRVFNYLSENGYKSHDLTQCGLHIHYTRPDDDTIDKIIVVMEHYKDELIKFSRRQLCNLKNYACFLSDCDENGGRDNEYFKSLYYIKKDNTKNNGRYKALNLQNKNTIEFRIFRGTLNTKTFFASLELCKNIVELCKNNDDITQITWEKLTKGRYISQYIKEKEIFTNKKIYDNSLLLELREKKEKRRKEMFVNFIKNELVNDFNTMKKQNNIDKKDFNDLYDIIYNKQNDYNKILRLYDHIKGIIDNLDTYDLKNFVAKIKYNVDCYGYTSFSDKVQKYIDKKEMIEEV